MLPLLLLTLASSASTHAQYNDSACPAAFAVQRTTNIPGALSTCIDNDPSFVYTADNCTSPSQKLINTGWHLEYCSAAFRALCGQTSPTAGVWLWSWMQDRGAACQVGIFQPIGQSEPIEEECCRRNFEIMLEAVTPPDVPSAYSTFNRVSVNIQPGGFPHTTALFDGAAQAVTSGVSVDGNSPSYILQGIAPQYPFSARNCSTGGTGSQSVPGSSSGSCGETGVC